MKQNNVGKFLWQLQLAGWMILFAVWFLVTNFSLINNHILPTPAKTWHSFIEMQSDDNLMANILFGFELRRSSIPWRSLENSYTGAWNCQFLVFLANLKAFSKCAKFSGFPSFSWQIVSYTVWFHGIFLQKFFFYSLNFLMSPNEHHFFLSLCFYNLVTTFYRLVIFRR